MFTRAVHVIAAVALAAAPAAPAADFFRNPFASFESRCEALPAGELLVEAGTLTFTEDHSSSLGMLSRRGEDLPGRHRTVGLTEGKLGYESTLESKGLEERRGGRVCVRPSIHVVFSATPMTVYIAREFAEDPCRGAAIRAHEMRHVEVYRRYLAELVEAMRQALPQLFGSSVVYGADATSAQEEMRARLRNFMASFMAGRYDELRARQAEIDTPEEYASLDRRCGPTSQGSVPTGAPYWAAAQRR